MIFIDFAGEVDELHECTNLKVMREENEVIRVYKKGAEWVLLLAYKHNYAGDEHAVRVFFCPFCGYKLPFLAGEK